MCGLRSSLTAMLLIAGACHIDFPAARAVDEPAKSGGRAAISGKIVDASAAPVAGRGSRCIASTRPTLDGDASRSCAKVPRPIGWGRTGSRVWATVTSWSRSRGTGSLGRSAPRTSRPVGRSRSISCSSRRHRWSFASRIRTASRSPGPRSGRSRARGERRVPSPATLDALARHLDPIQRCGGDPATAAAPVRRDDQGDHRSSRTRAGQDRRADGGPGCHGEGDDATRHRRHAACPGRSRGRADHGRRR